MVARIGRAVAVACTVLAVVATAACGSAVDDRTHITVWSWEPSMEEVVDRFEEENPDIVVDLENISGYDNLNTAIQDGYGMPDVAQIEYFALLQYAVSGQLLDISDYVGDDYPNFYTPGTWSSVQLAGRIYGLPMDSGPMAFFYNKDVFDQAGVDATKIRTWDDYYEAAKKLKQIGAYITADAGDASFYAAMIWLAGGQPFHTSPDGRTVTVDLDGDEGTKRFTEFWQKMIDEGLIDTRRTTWSDGWKRALGTGTVASVFSGAWMPSMLLSNVLGAAGLWRVAPMPTPDGRPTNAENGGSAMTVLQSTRKPEAAYRFVDFVTHDRQGIEARVAGGSFPADLATLSSREFLTKTTVRASNGIDIPYFGGQQFNRVLAEAAENVSVGYQYLPFEVYSRSDFRTTVGKSYKWSSAWQSYVKRQREVQMGMTDEDGNPLQPFDDPGPKVSLRKGIAAWQADLREYGTNQGFTVK
ncbi:ABC transporter substrate-binding protein [Bifidobacterium platyrrhinorum]|nr:sugar ABC transporter substrate-binding protein [Bifidobacterium platyrrhinorum]